MISRKELIKRLRDDINTEEIAVVLYTKHLKDTLQFAGVSDEVRGKMIALLDKLTEESRTHEKVMKELLTRIANSSRDVY